MANYELVLDEAGHVKVQDGKPVYMVDGKEVAFDAAFTVGTITRLQSEAKGHRLKAEDFESKLKVFEGLDPEAARKALETVSTIDAKKLIDAGEVDRVKAETAKAWEDKLKANDEKYKPVVEERDGLRSELTNLRIGGAFDRSPYIKDKLILPTDAAQALFGPHFKDEGGAVVGYHKNGEKIYSRERPGEVAGFDEAMSILVEGYANRDSILKGSGASGGGAPGSSGGAGSKTVNRQQFESMDPASRASFFKSGGKLTD